MPFTISTHAELLKEIRIQSLEVDQTVKIAFARIALPKQSLKHNHQIVCPELAGRLFKVTITKKNICSLLAFDSIKRDQ